MDDNIGWQIYERHEQRGRHQHPGGIQHQELERAHDTAEGTMNARNGKRRLPRQHCRQHEQHCAANSQEHAGDAPAIMPDERSRERRNDQHAASGAGGGRAKRRVALPGEPSAEDREGRHVGTGRAYANTNAVGQISLPHLPNETGENEATSHHRRT
jgi:hypothetical protein